MVTDGACYRWPYRPSSQENRAGYRGAAPHQDSMACRLRFHRRGAAHRVMHWSDMRSACESYPQGSGKLLTGVRLAQKLHRIERRVGPLGLSALEAGDKQRLNRWPFSQHMEGSLVAAHTARQYYIADDDLYGLAILEQRHRLRTVASRDDGVTQALDERARGFEHLFVVVDKQHQLAVSYRYDLSRLR